MQINPAEFKLLVVDDVQTNVLLLKALLGKEGYGILVSNNGQSTKIYDRTTGEILRGRVPAGSVVVPGSLPSKDGTYNLNCAVIVKIGRASCRERV